MADLERGANMLGNVATVKLAARIVRTRAVSQCQLIVYRSCDYRIVSIIQSSYHFDLTKIDATTSAPY